MVVITRGALDPQQSHAPPVRECFTSLAMSLRQLILSNRLTRVKFNLRLSLGTRLYGGIVGVGIVVILFIWIATQFSLPEHIVRGIILIAVSALFFLVSGAIFSHSPIVGSVVGIIAIVLLFVGINALTGTDNNKQAQRLQLLTRLLIKELIYPFCISSFMLLLGTRGARVNFTLTRVYLTNENLAS